MQMNTPNTKALGFDWPDLARVQSDVARIAGDRRATDKRLTDLHAEKQRAEAADQEAYASALLEGKGEPKTSAVEKVEAQIATLAKRRQALEIALRKLSDDRARVLRENGTAWRAEVLDRLPAAQRKAEEATAALGAAVEELNALAGLHDWISSPEAGYRRKAPVGRVQVQGQAVDVSAVLEALRAQTARLGVRETGAA